MARAQPLGRVQRYALVYNQGGRAGARRNTTLAVLLGRYDDGRYVGMRIGNKTRRSYDPSDIVCIWRGMPSREQVRAQKAKLPVRAVASNGGEL